MENNFLPKLCGVEFQNNKIEKDEPLIITTRWKNIGEGRADFRGRIAVDLDFFGYQRLEENNDTNYTVKWSPFPAVYQWEKDEIIATTGIFRNKGNTWGGSYKINVALLDDNGNRVKFVGKDGNMVDHEFVEIVDIGWGHGKKRLWATDRYKNYVYDDEFTEKTPAPAELLFNNFWRFDNNEGVLIGCGDWQYDAQIIEVHTRKIDTDTHRYLHGSEDMEIKLINADKNELRYKVGTYCGSFHIVYSGTYDKKLRVSLENAVMDEGFEIISVYFPCLISADEKAKMVDLYFGGRLVDVKTTVPMGLRHPFDADELGSLYDDNQHLVIDTSDLNTVLYQSINEINGKKSGVVGIELFIMKAAHKAGLKSIMLPHPSDCRIQSAEVGWNAASKILREKYHSNGNHLYDRTITYKILADCGPRVPEDAGKYPPPMTLAQIRKVVQDMNKAFDGAHQVSYIIGWQFEGHDTGFPNIDRVAINPRFECTEQELVDFLAECREYNASVSLHDNFEDIYLEPGTTTEHTGLDCYGEMYKCWIWNGGQGYIQMPKKVVDSGRARERITNIVKRFNIKDTYHLDGLTSEILREDFDPAMPTSFHENIEAKKEIVKIWNEFGIDISSESLTSPLVGTIGHAWSTRDRLTNATFYPGEFAIPVVAMACHGIIPYNMIQTGDLFNHDFLMWGIAYGGYAGIGDVSEVTTAHINGTYLQSVPISLIEYEKMVSCDVSEDYINVEYTNNCHVYCDKKNQKYEIVKNGVVIGKDFTTFAEGFKPDTYLAYSDHDCTVVYDAPEGWTDATAIEFLNGDKEITAEIKDGKITLTLTAYQPVRVTKK